MTKKYLFMNIIFLFIAIVLCAISGCSARLSDKRLCYDPECSEPVSLARTSIKYTANDPDILSFGSNEKAKIYSKEAGSRLDLWGVEINGKRGYGPKSFFKEYKVLQKKLQHEVPVKSDHNDNVKVDVNDASKTKEKDGEVDKATPASKKVHKENTDKNENLNGASPAYEVVDGTTINLHSEQTVQPSFVTEVVQATTVPNIERNDIPGVDILLAKHNETIFSKTNEKISAHIKQEIEGENNGLSQNSKTKPLLDSSKNEIDSLDIVGIPTDIPEFPHILNGTEHDINSNNNKGTGNKGQHESVKQEKVEEQVLKKKDDSSESVNNVELQEKDSTTQQHKTEGILKSSPLVGILAKKVPENIAVQKTTAEKGSSESIETETPKLATAFETTISSTDTLAENDKHVEQQLNHEAIQDEPKEKKDELAIKPLVHDDNSANSSVSKETVLSKENEGTGQKLQSEIQDQQKVKEDTLATQPLVEHNNLANATLLNDNIISQPDHPKEQEVKNKAIEDNSETKEDTVTIKPLVHDDDSANSSVSKETVISKKHESTEQKLQSEVQDEEKAKEDTLATQPPVEHNDLANATLLNDNIISQPEHPKEQEVNNKAIEDNPKAKEDTVTIKPLVHDDDSANSSVSKETVISKKHESTEQKLQSEIENEQKTKEEIVTITPLVHDDNSADAPLSKDNAIGQPGDVASIVESEATSQEPLVNATLETVPIDAATSVNKDIPVNYTTIDQETSEAPKIQKDESESETKFITNDLKQEPPQNVEVPSKNETSINTTSTDFTVSQHDSIVPVEAMIIEEVKPAIPDLENVFDIPAPIKLHQTDKKVEEPAQATVINTELDIESNYNSVEDVLEEKAASSTEELLNLEHSEEASYSSQENLISEHIGFNEFRNRNLLNAEVTDQYNSEDVIQENTDRLLGETLPESGDDTNSVDDTESTADSLTSIALEAQVSSPDVCMAEDDCTRSQEKTELPSSDEGTFESEENAIMSVITVEQSYWLTLMYATTTGVTVLMFCLGYYYIENMRRDSQLIAKINKLEKDLLVATKECTVLTDNLTVTKEKLLCIEDESFGSNEMVLSLKADLEGSQAVKAELEDQIAMLEKDLESATEAGLELERMLREVLSSNNEVNPLAESVEDLQGRLNAQQAENESLLNTLNIKLRENDILKQDLAKVKKTLEQFKLESKEAAAGLKEELEKKNAAERELTDKFQRLEMQLKEISTQKALIQKELKSREAELKDLSDVVTQLNCNNLDLNKLYDVSRIKAEATALFEERNELRIRLSEVEGAHNLLEEHMKLVNEEISSLSEQSKLAEKEKKDAETRLEVLTNFFNEKEAQRQKEEAIWLQKQGEVVSTVERIQSMQNEIQNYKQQIEMLKREILDQEREYKGHISHLETKAHEQWVVARQVERRLEESKAESGQLRNRLTLIEKNINDADPESKLHRLEANGDTATSPPPLYIGPDSSSSPIMFSGPAGVLPPPPPPSYMHHSMFPHYMPPPMPSGGMPPFEVGQRPPPLGGRLSSPPPIPLPGSASGRYENAVSPPPHMPPHMLPPYNHRSPPPPFGNDHLHPPPPPPPGSMLPPPPLGSTHSWGEETLPPLRNSNFHPHQREQRVRNHKGSFHSSGDSLDKSHHNSKV